MVPYADLTISAPISKRCFLKCYAEAREKALKPKTITAAFRKAGIWPPNRRRPLEHEKIVGEVIRPTTPPSPLPPTGPENASGLYYTPKRSQDLKNQFLDLEKKTYPLTRDQRTLVGKAGKSIDLLASQLAIMKQENQSLKLQIEGLKPTGKKTVKKDPNEAFYEIEAIHEARIAAEKQGERWQKDHADDLEKQRKKIAETKFESMLGQFHLADS
jgi:hypothetical protein